MKTPLSFLALIAATACAFAQVTPGKPAPDFTLKDASGKEHKLSDYKGKTVVLEWVNFGCPFVKKHYGSQNMQKLQQAATDKGIVWLSICSSAPGKQGHFAGETLTEEIKKEGSKATAYLVDESGEVGKLYGAKTTPEMFVITPEGTLVYGGAIDNNKSPDPSTIAGAKNYVTQALGELAEGKTVSEASTQSYGCSVKYP